ncbi:hypothetical protein DEO72_LG1g2015 [Vigna unguiculata]|uniref:Uncharacterized protein n=1 Tax=Vigna unguiculata TaxID=3917 RepID=A0A4D6KPF4_VIGUN|nr:hypothetical protein DEO72_LG1g2015 [Vigna unguiculata]
MGQAKNFSPPAHDSPARQARWPKRTSLRPVPLTKTHKHVPYFFYYPSSLTTARAPHHQKPQLCDSSSFLILIFAPHTQTRFSSTHSPLATTKDAGHHVAASHTFFSSTVSHGVAARSEKTAPCTENAEPPSDTTIGGRFRPPRPPPTQDDPFCES